MAEETESTRETAPAESGKPVSNLPFIITLIALLLYFAFQTLSLLGERSNLAFVKSNQEGALQEAQKMQAQFKLLVSKTGELADQGHAGAKMIMEGLQRQGVGFTPESSAPVKPEVKATK